MKPNWKEKIIAQSEANPRLAAFRYRQQGGLKAAKVVEDHFNLTPVLAEEPETAQPETAQPETAQPETAQPETAQPETAQPAPRKRKSKPKAE
jgi:hypothetical protein